MLFAALGWCQLDTGTSILSYYAPCTFIPHPALAEDPGASWNPSPFFFSHSFPDILPFLELLYASWIRTLLSLYVSRLEPLNTLWKIINASCRAPTDCLADIHQWWIPYLSKLGVSHPPYLVGAWFISRTRARLSGYKSFSVSVSIFRSNSPLQFEKVRTGLQNVAL